MRLFLALFPPKEILYEFRDILRKFDKQKRNLKHIPVDQIHLTIKFLGGEVSEYSRDIIAEELHKHEGNFGRVKLKINEIRFGFEKEKNPWVVLARLKRSQDLIQLTDNVHEIIKGLRLRDTIRFKRRYAYNFHISLSRMKRTGTKSTGHMIRGITDKIGKIDVPEFELDRMYLMESEITKTGPTYKKQDVFML